MAITEITKFKTTGIDHVALHVSDFERSKDFYIHILGMTEHHGGSDYCFLKCGNQAVGLFGAGVTSDQTGVKPSHIAPNVKTSPDGEARPNFEAHMAFNIDAGTYEEIKANLEAHGIAVFGRQGDPRGIYFDDPDGHVLQIMPTDHRSGR